jgi:hypothetical protein
VEVFDEAALPLCMVKTKTTTAPDKSALKAALLAGAEVPGARIVVGDETLQVR